MLTLGKRVDASPGADATFRIAPEVLLRHAVFLGASGSGKTVASKVLVEEMLRSGIPAILVDPQGDLASLAIPGDPAELVRHGVPDDVAREVHARAEVVIWTPGSEAGIPLGLSPLSLAGLPADPDGRSEALGLAARAVCNLLGLNMEKEEGKSAEASIVLCLEDAAARGIDVGGFEGLATMLGAPPTALATRLAGVADHAARDGLAKKIRRALIGSTGRLFDRGVPLDIDVLLGRDERLTGAAGNREAYARTRCSVIYLNSLTSSEEKEFFLAELCRALIRWMLQHPSEKPQALFFVDEIAPFLPPVRKPACRDALRILVKQARKYGIACVFATQNPGDVDYKSLAQCSTWGLGRLTQKQDLKKLETFLKGVAPEHAAAIAEMLPSRPAGELLYLAPDVEKGMIPVKTRWLATEHRTLDLDDVKKLTSPEMRAKFQALAAKMRQRPPVLPTPMAPVAEPAALEPAPEPPAAKAKSQRAPSEKGRARAAAPIVDEDDDEPGDAEATPSEIETVKPRLVELLLKEIAALTADEVAALAPDVPVGRVRRALKELAEAQALERERCGRSFVHWHPKHVFDLEAKKLRAVLVVEPRILEGDALARAQSKTRSKFIFFDAETVSGLKLHHLPLHRVRVRAKRQRGFFTKEEYTVEATLYVHPRAERVLELSGQSDFHFVQAPTQKAEDVQDLDQVVKDWTRVSPGLLSVKKEHEPTLTASAIEQAIKKKFAIDEVLGIDLVHLPFWEFHLVDGAKKTERTAAIDALLGSPFSPESATTT
jgi:hypothetical protein